MLLPIFPGYKGPTNTIFFVGGDESSDFLAQRLKSFAHHFWGYFHVLYITLRNAGAWGSKILDAACKVAVQR
jgi:hypothetical protein